MLPRDVPNRGSAICGGILTSGQSRSQVSASNGDGRGEFPDRVGPAERGRDRGLGDASGVLLRPHSRNWLTMGRRQSLPKARGVILIPMGPCRRLYSFLSTIAITRFTVASSK